MSEEKPKRKYQKKPKPSDDMFDLGFGMMYGAIVGIGHMEMSLQLLGKPHKKEFCFCGVKCPIHGEDFTNE